VLTSESRILTTHAGSLPRPADLADAHGRRSRREVVDSAELRIAIADAPALAIDNQRRVGIDIGTDGEQARESFFTYVQHRMSGFGGASERGLFRDLREHDDFV
jgi:5-methyltetrahydropteroyltriglutamate--homocysteine methyltransferase